MDSPHYALKNLSDNQLWLSHATLADDPSSNVFQASSSLLLPHHVCVIYLGFAPVFHAGNEWCLVSSSSFHWDPSPDSTLGTAGPSCSSVVFPFFFFFKLMHHRHSLRLAGSIPSSVPGSLVTTCFHFSISSVTVGFCECAHKVKAIAKRESWKPKSLGVYFGSEKPKGPTKEMRSFRS